MAKFQPISELSLAKVMKFQPISELSLAKVLKFQPISELSLASDEISTNNRALVTLVLVHDHELTKH